MSIKNWSAARPIHFDCSEDANCCVVWQLANKRLPRSKYINRIGNAFENNVRKRPLHPPRHARFSRSEDQSGKLEVPWQILHLHSKCSKWFRIVIRIFMGLSSHPPVRSPFVRSFRCAFLYARASAPQAPLALEVGGWNAAGVGDGRGVMADAIRGGVKRP